MLCTLQTRIFDSREDYLSNEPFFVENLHSREILHIYSAVLNYKMWDNECERVLGVEQDEKGVQLCLFSLIILGP